MNAGDAFSSTDEIIAFSELMNKSFKISGADAQAQAGAMRQLTQALASGVLRGDEFNSIAEQAPMVYQAIADYMGKSKGEVRALAQEGALSAAVVKNAMFEAARSIEDKFVSMPMTFSDQWTRMKNDALMAFQPVLTMINEMLNNPAVQAFANSISNGFYVLASGAQWALGKVSKAAAWAQDHMEQLKTGFIILGAVIAAVATAAAIAWAIANWPILLIISTIMLLVGVLDQFGVTSEQTLNFVMGLFGGLYAFIYNIVAEIYNVLVSFAEFFANFLNDPIGSIFRLFGNLCDFVLGIVQTIASAIDAVFGSNLADAVSGLRGSLAASYEATVGKAAIEFERMEQMKVIDGWNKGVKLAGNISDGFNSAAERFATLGAGMDLAMPGVSSSGMNMDEIGRVGSVGRIDDEVSIKEENIKLLKDIAAQEFQLNLAHYAPNLTANFGDIRETADVDVVYDQLVRRGLDELRSDYTLQAVR
jgi:tape measure domain-containing protein